MSKATTLPPYERATKPFSRNWEIEVSALLLEKFAVHLRPNEGIRVESLYGDNCAFLRALVGTENKAHVFEFFTDTLEPSEKEFGLLLDFFDGVLEEFFAHRRNAGLPLDFTKRQFEKVHLFARQEYHDFEAERLAENLLKS